MEREEFEEVWPEYKKGGVPLEALHSTASGWFTDDKVRICEYFRKVEHKDKLISFVDPQSGEMRQVLGRELPKGVAKELLAMPDTISRETTTTEIEWHLIVGTQIKETKVWPGKYIPIVRVIGEETVLDGRLDRKGHTRALKDPQRMYNYWSSSAVEHVALQGKTPWVAPAEAIEGYETYWESANRVNHAVLPYNGKDDSGNPMPPPQKPQPPQMAQAYIQGMQVASAEMMMASGQYESQMGEKGNERSGKAIVERQRKGDNATYHYVDNLAVAIRFTGVILLDLIPRIYDTRRILQVLGEDGTNISVTVDPEAKQSLVTRAGVDGQIIERVFNPGLGQYMVQAEVGPGYGTKREQAFDAFVTLITQAPNLTSVIGDIMLRAADFPMADEAAERIKRTLPPQVLGQGPTQQEQALQGQLQALQGLLDASTEELAKAKLQLKGKDQLRDIDAYEAETKRMQALAAAIDPQALRPVIETLVAEALQTSSLSHIFGANQQGSVEAEQRQAGQGAAEPGMEVQPRRAPDGNLYLPHPGVPGKWLRMEAPQEAPEAQLAFKGM
jgi:hypothetical protein